MPRKKATDNKPASPPPVDAPAPGKPAAHGGGKPRKRAPLLAPVEDGTVDTPHGKAKQAQAADSGAEFPVNLADTSARRTILTSLDATIPVVIPPGARSPVDDIIEVLHREVIGQERAIEAIARALLRSREGFRTPGRPISTMFFAGPTGVGKTETVRALARALHDDWRAILKIDCSEYSEPHAVARLIGAPPGYIGSDLPAIFTKENVEGVKNRLILFDEIEKAHFRLHHLLLQIMDEGRITLARRTKDDDGQVSFEDCIIILTSNIGASDIESILHAHRIGFRNEPVQATAQTDQQIYNAAKEALRMMFPPEFRNRLTEFIVFRALERQSLYKILQKLLNISAERFASLGFQLVLSKETRDWLVDRGVDQELGVRPLVRAVEKYIDTRVAELHAYGLIQAGDFLEARMEDSPEPGHDGGPRKEIVFFRAPRQGEAGGEKRLPSEEPAPTTFLIGKY